MQPKHVVIKKQCEDSESCKSPVHISTRLVRAGQEFFNRTSQTMPNYQNWKFEEEESLLRNFLFYKHFQIGRITCFDKKKIVLKMTFYLKNINYHKNPSKDIYN